MWLQQFGVYWPNLIAQVVLFAIVYWVLKRYAFKPVIAMLEERRRRIEEGQLNAENIKKQLAAAQAKYEEILAKANAEAQRLIEEVRASGDRLAEQKRQEADCCCRADHFESAGSDVIGKRSSHGRDEAGTWSSGGGHNYPCDRQGVNP